MARLVRAKVQKAVLVWARESAGFTQAEAAKRVGISESRIIEWETRKRAPTIGQLQKLADAYKRPLSVLYLQEPPTLFQPMRDFRRMPGSGLRRFFPDLALEIRIAQQRRQLAIDLREETGGDNFPFNQTATLRDNSEAVGEQIRKILNVSAADRAEWRNDPAGYAAFNSWRSRIENLNVLVFQAARIASDEVSGFAIAEEFFPVIVVSRKDTPPKRRTFSLLHEFSHLMLRMSGVSDLDVDAARPPEDAAVEVFCNQVAAATLIPRDAFLGEPLLKSHASSSDDWSDETIAELALNYSVSREALVRRLLTFRLTTLEFYRKKREQYNEEYRQYKERQREKSKQPGADFLRNPPRDALTNFGKPLVRMILDSYYQERMSLSDVSGYLGIRTRHIPKLEHIVGLRGR